MTPAYKLLSEMFATKGFRQIHGMPHLEENLQGLCYSSAFYLYWSSLGFTEGQKFAEQQNDIVLLLNQVVNEPEASDVS